MGGLTRASIQTPAAVAVGVAIVILFGLISLSSLPVQLFPDIERPQISIGTNWRAATPREIESELIEPQEDVLAGIPGLVEMQAWANAGSSWINLTFSLDTDMKATVVDVIGRLNRLPPLPDDADPPFVQMGGGGNSNESLLFIFMQVLPGNTRAVEDYERFVEDVVMPRMETIPGVAGVQFESSNGPRELQIVFDPLRAAQLGIELPKVAALAGRANDTSGGTVDVGRRQYSISFRGRFSPDELKDLVLEWRDGKPVRLGDIAEVGVGRGKRQGFNYQNGNPALGMRVMRASGANVLATVNAVKDEMERINTGPAKEQGVVLVHSFDPSHFINQALGMVTSNLMIGILLAVGVLWFFLRAWRATVIIAVTIPICMLAVIVVLGFTGRTINVIALAGIAFAVGMVLDAGIVVLENILRLRERGTLPGEAAEKGAGQVWGALIASTATTVAIFLPIIFVKDVEGQLFADLALTIAVAVVISLLVAITVIPAASKLFLHTRPRPDGPEPMWANIADGVMRLTETPFRRRALIGGLVAGSLGLTWLLVPTLNYLPSVKRAAVDVFMRFPPGVTVDFVDDEIAKPVMARLEPYMTGEKEPALKNYYFGLWGPWGANIGIRVLDDSRLKEMEGIVRRDIITNLPDTQAFAAIGNLFGGFDEGGGVAVHIQATDTEAMRQAAKRGYDILKERIPDGIINVGPNLEFAQPELRIIPNDRRIAEVGWTRSEVARVVRALGDGLYIGEHFDGHKRLNIILKAKPWGTPEELSEVPVSTPSGQIVPLGDLVSITRTVGPSTVQRVDRRRTFTLFLGPPEGMSLQEAIEIVQTEVEPAIRAALPADGRITYGGGASSLSNALWTMGTNFGMAIVLLFLIMAALFRSIRDAGIVTLCLPLATVGGMAAIQILNFFTFQPLDLLTMIGFVILLGLVVNNAILLVVRTRQAEDEGLSRNDAVRSSLETRLRPIFSSTLTTVFGMLPLVVIPGAGTEIYRGLGAAIVGGMAISFVFTLILMPALLRLGEGRGAAAKQSAPKPARKAA